MDKILVIFTGGTIGSSVNKSTINVDYNGGYKLINLYKDKFSNKTEFDTLQPLNILSENFTPKHWEILCGAIDEVCFDKYTGIIITHGTDTLSFTSSIVSLLYYYTKIPIVLIGSNHALESPNSNGLMNFSCAVDFILNTNIAGIFTIFQDNEGKNKVYLGTRICESDHYNDQYISYGGVNFGEIINKKFVLNINKINPNIEQLQIKRNKILNHIKFVNQVLAIKAYPGLDYSYFNLEKKPKAILHSLYHSATGCTTEGVYSLPEFIKKCRDLGIDFYLISFKNKENDLYASSKEILEYGAIPLYNISFEAAYAKLSIAYNQSVLQPIEYIKKEQYFEFLP